MTSKPENRLGRFVIRVGLASLAALYLLFKSPINSQDGIVSVILALVVWLAAELLAAPRELELEPEVSR